MKLFTKALGVALIGAALLSNYAFAYCAHGVVVGTATVYSCVSYNCSGVTPLQYEQAMDNCVMICCPDGSSEFSQPTCDPPYLVKDINNNYVCCDYGKTGYWYIGLSCSQN
jgi:hypothetical protein